MNKFISTIKKIFAPIDLTKGKPYKVIILFALPILLSNLINQVYHLADAIVVGQTIPQQFAGINDTNPLSFLIIHLFYSLIEVQLIKLVACIIVKRKAL